MATIDQLLVETQAAWDDGPRLAVLGRELQTRNRLDHARRVLERATLLAPGDVDAWANLAYACYRSFRDRDGAAALERGIAATGSDSLRGILASFTEDAEEAERLRAGIAGTSDVAAEAGLLSQRFGAGEREEALAGLRALFARRPDDDDVRETLLWVLIWARNQGMEGIDLAGEALPLAEEGIRRRPESMGPRWMLLMLLNAAKDWDGLLGATADALARFPDEETVMQFRARAFREQGDLLRAAAWCLRAIGAKPSFVGARIDLGRILEQQGRHDLAEEVFREIPAANPAYAPGPMSLALFLARRGRLEEAERVFLDTWPRIPAPWRQGIRNHPDAQALLARDAVRLAVEA